MPRGSKALGGVRRLRISRATGQALRGVRLSLETRLGAGHGTKGGCLNLNLKLRKLNPVDDLCEGLLYRANT